MQSTMLLLALAALVGSAYATNATSNATTSTSTSNATTSTASVAKQITHVITIGQTVAEYTGDVKLLTEVNWSIITGIYNPTANAYYTGCSVTSTAAAARRAVAVTIVATTSAAKGTAAVTAAGSMTATSFNAALAAAKTALGTTCSTCSTISITASAVSTPVSITAPGGTTSGVDKLCLSLSAMAVTLFALRH